MTVARPERDSWHQPRVFIDGKWQASSGSRIPVYDCATEEVIGSVASCTPSEVDAAVSAARNALPHWSSMPPSRRASILRAWHDELARHTAELTGLISAEVGTAVHLCEAVQVASAISLLAMTADTLDVMNFEEQVGSSLVLRVPVGVVAAMTPWNYPLFQSMGKVAAAVAAGCTVVHKPSEVAPLSAIVVAQAAERSGVPRGVYNLLTGTGEAVGRRLAGHADVDMISFTGSTAVGVSVLQQAAIAIKRVTLELGGKSASVLLDDAPLERAVHTSVNRAFLNSGQTCDAWTRLLVPRGRMSDVLDLVRVHTGRLIVGDPFDEATRLGPLVSARQQTRVRSYVQDAIASGATVITGGAAPPAGLERGHYVQATVLSDVTTGMAAAREEIFGPVLVVMAYDSEEDASAIADATPYGLSGAVWSADQDRAVAFARCMRAGQVVINGARFDPRLPFGGLKQSGMGRELGRYGIEGFLDLKAFVI